MQCHPNLQGQLVIDLLLATKPYSMADQKKQTLRKKRVIPVKRKKLEMSFDPNTIEHLGIKMYSSLPTAIAELIANAYDADAQKVEIYLVDKTKNREIIVADNGIGMSFDDINNFFLK